jgi:hypothetical protein
MTENRLKISSPERIQRILQRVSEAKIPVVLRVRGVDSSISIKARAAAMVFDGSARSHVEFSAISAAGISMIETGVGVQIEFATMATKIMFVAPVLERGIDRIRVGFPRSLISLERRSSDRFLCRDHLMAFVRFSLWEPEQLDVTAPPIYTPHLDIAPLLALADVSVGGICAISRFPSVCSALSRGVVDRDAQVLLPMQAPIPVTVEVRWVKKIKEHATNVQTDGSLSLYSRFFRFGIQFKDQSDAFKVAIKQFTQQLALRDAI